MKIKKIGLLVGLSLLTMGLVACGNNEDSVASTKQNNVQKKVTYDNQENVDGVIEALNSVKPKFKASSLDWEDGGECWVIYTSYGLFSDDNRTVTEYGYDDPVKGTSIVAFATKNGLNNEQSNAIYSLSSGYDENGISSEEIWKNYPNDAENISPYQGADVDYVTISDLKTEPSETEPNKLQITGKVTYHLHLLDGTEVDHEFKTSATPDSKTGPIDEKFVEDALHPDKMNEDLPVDRSGYNQIKVKEINSGE
ncbi:hypothetical protein [Enterococcus mundtii]|uniref:hypothetical protein n=1 Tax=Enterococcus mundtii TaxID=53346 RepID=UPI000E063E99|nr:hypothetical protein [Enterococcus mundtii]STE38122.1 Uncharacterised protein [Enterococcus mundtii]